MRYEGAAGWVERHEFPPRRYGTLLDVWFMCCPNQSPAPEGWETYSLMLIHLHPDPDLPPPKLDYPGATHELFVQAIDPEGDVSSQTPLPWPHLHPANARVQFHVHDDDQARHVSELVARAVADGMLTAETSIYLFPDDEHPDGQIKLIAQLLDHWTATVRNTADHERNPDNPHGAMN